MRRNRITTKKAQKIWDSIRKSVRIAPYQGGSMEPPHIDMAEIFAGRKSMKADELEREIVSRIKSWQPLYHESSTTDTQRTAV